MKNTKFICVAGKNDVAVDVLRYLLDHYKNYEYGVVCNKTETGENSFQKSLRYFAKMWGIREYVMEELYNIDGLLLLSLEYDLLIKPEKFKGARLYNIHFSLLPKYKGMYTSAWPILNGEQKTGVTLHRINPGIDTGDIIDQKSFSINGLDCRDVYLEYVVNGIEVVIRNIEALIAGKEISRRQPSVGSTYYSKSSIDYGNLVVDLNQTAEGIGKQIRAHSFREFQMPLVNGKYIIAFEYTNERSMEKPGTILVKQRDSMLMSTVDYNIVLYFDRFDELCEVCRVGDIGVVSNICSVKKHINQREIRHGWTPLIIATYNNHKDIVKWLICHGANIYVVNNNGTNLLMYAKDVYKNCGDKELLELYLRLGIDINQKDYYGKSLAEYCNEEGLTNLI